MYPYVDYFKEYGRIMQFNKNKGEPVHRWYSFVEGYSKEFIQSIVNEIEDKNVVCLEPFSGSGTTSLELQKIGMKCISFEVNPFMYLVGKVKLFTGYKSDELKKWFDYLSTKYSKSHINSVFSCFSSLYQSENNKKWNLDTEVAIAVEKLRLAINQISDKYYRDLFTVALASILLDVSNLYRNGKCLSYKRNWKTTNLTEKDVYNKFSDKVLGDMLTDISGIEREWSDSRFPDNYNLLYNDDCRYGIGARVEDNSIGLVITSPPYLNSRDYTDTYMLELKTLGFAKNTNDISGLRKRTLRSHVQIKWKDSTRIDNDQLENTIDELKQYESDNEVWNSSIVDMVRLYFVDMKKLFSLMNSKMKRNGKVYFNVSNSAYFGIKVDTLNICASIAESEGFTIKEIREARLLKTSPQQKMAVDKLLEGVIVMEKKR